MQGHFQNHKPLSTFWCGRFSWKDCMVQLGHLTKVVLTGSHDKNMQTQSWKRSTKPAFIAVVFLQWPSTATPWGLQTAPTSCWQGSWVTALWFFLFFFPRKSSEWLCRGNTATTCTEKEKKNPRVSRGGDGAPHLKQKYCSTTQLNGFPVAGNIS